MIAWVKTTFQVFQLQVLIQFNEYVTLYSHGAKWVTTSLILYHKITVYLHLFNIYIKSKQFLSFEIPFIKAFNFGLKWLNHDFLNKCIFFMI